VEWFEARLISDGNVKRTAKARSSLEFRYLNFVRGSVRIIFERISWIASDKKDSHPMLCVRDFLSIQIQRREMHKNFFYLNMLKKTTKFFFMYDLFCIKLRFKNSILIKKTININYGHIRVLLLDMREKQIKIIALHSCTYICVAVFSCIFQH